MSFDAAYAALKAQHLEGRVRRFPGSSATVALAAQELGTAEGAIAKTMALLGPDGPILVLAAGDRKIDGGSFKRTFHFKPKFVPGTDVEALVLSDSQLATNLLGMSFLSRLKSFAIENGRLVLSE